MDSKNKKLFNVITISLLALFMAAGCAGKNGANGTNGAAGPAGATGSAGTQGPAGPQGATGASGTSGANMPVINGIYISPNPVVPGGAASASVTAQAPSGTTLTYTWSVTSGWSVTPNGSTAVIIAPNALGMSGDISVQVKDSNGNVVDGSIAVSTGGWRILYRVGSQPQEIAADSADNAWITNLASNDIMKLGAFSGLVSQAFTMDNGPYGIAIDASGNIWVASSVSSTITGITPQGIQIGHYSVGYTMTTDCIPFDAAVSSSGNVWIVGSCGGYDGFVEEMSPSGSIITSTTISGNSVLVGVVIDHSGNVWATDEANGNVIKLSPSGNVIGTYHVSGYPVGIAVDAYNNVWIAGIFNLTELNQSGFIIGSYYNTGGTNLPIDVAIDSSHNIWVTNYFSDIVGELTSTGTLEATYTVGSSPLGIAIDGSDNVWVANSGSNSVSIITDTTGTPITNTYGVGITPYAVSIDPSTGHGWVTNMGSENIMALSIGGSVITTVSVNFSPGGIAITTSGYVWVTNGLPFAGGVMTLSVTVINTSSYTQTTYLPLQVPVFLKGDPEGIAIDSSGNMWLANYGNSTVSEMSASGVTLATFTVGTCPKNIAIDQAKYVWVTDPCTNNIFKLNGSGIQLTVAVGGSPDDVAIDQFGDVWITIPSLDSIAEFYSDGITVGTYPVGIGPSGIAIDASGNVWVANSGDNTITKLEPSGNYLGTYDVGVNPQDIAIDKDGDVWVTDGGDNTVTEFAFMTSGPEYFPYTGPQWP